MAEFEFIELSERGAVAEIRLARPEKHNAMNPALHEEMSRALGQLEAREGVKVLILTGTGGSFCAGMDLEAMFLEPHGDPDEFRRRNSSALRWFLRLHAFPGVTIAKVNGLAFGGGVALIGFCDIAIASSDATFGLSEINFGIFPGGGTSWAAASNMNRKLAHYYVLTGERFDAAAALRAGLVTEAVDTSELDERVGELARCFEGKSRYAIGAAKEVLERVERMPLGEAIDYEMAKLHELSYVSSEDWIRRGLEQFSQRRYRPGEEPYELGEEGR